VIVKSKEWQPFEARQESVLTLLKQSSPLTVEQIAESQGLSLKGAASLVARIRDVGGPIYVAGFSGNGPHAARRYAYGLEPDVEYVPAHKPRAVTDSEEEAMDRERRHRLLKKIKPFRDPLIAAFYGEAPCRQL
jgi:hypothetical protein